jgi:Leucine-rich repeat (LRR) protein
MQVKLSEFFGNTSFRSINDVQKLSKIRTLHLIFDGLETSPDLTFLKWFNHLKTLSFDRLPDGKLLLPDCNSLHNLKAFSVFNLKSGFDEVGKLINLSKLSISGFEAPDLQWLSGLNSLETLDIGGCKLDSLFGIQYLPIHELFLTEIAPPLFDLCPLADLIRLNSLRLIRIHSLEVFPDLSRLHHLQKITLYKMNKLSDVSNLKKCRSLASLRIGECPKIKPLQLELLKDHTTLRQVSYELHSKRKGAALRKLLPEHIYIVGHL